MKKISTLQEKHSSDDLYYDCLLALGYSKKEIDTMEKELTPQEALSIVNKFSNKEIKQIIVNIANDNSLYEAKNKAQKVGLLLTALLSLGISLTTLGCDTPFLLNVQGYEVMEDSLNTAWKHVASYPYKRIANNLPSPAEFEANPGGMCGGFAATLVYYLGKDASMAIVPMEKIFTSDTSGKYHAVVYYDGQFIEPQIPDCVYEGLEISDCTFLWDYDETMMITTSFGLRNIDQDIAKEAQSLRKRVENLSYSQVPAVELLGLNK